MTRPVFGRPETGRPAYYRDPLDDVRLPARSSGPILELCNPPADHRRGRFLELVQARGWPCHRCIANNAPAGSPARCHFLTARRIEP